MEYKSYLKQLLEATIKNNASDFHIAKGRPPVMRISRKLVFFSKENKFTAEDTKNLAFALMTEEQQQRFLIEKEIDFSYSFESKA
ncbi:MAG: type IV pili twitching motility protein PilT, partial [Candidatus Pacebacteria bacterium]|nr:type IV pili twitching motility protein PilT [Candidatus Paceibacterota bacterium]